MEFGLTTFAEITDPTVSPGERLRQVVEEAQLADDLGLEIYAIGEHHRSDMAASAPEIVLSTIAGCTKTIKLSSAVNVLSSADPVRVFQNFVTLDLLSNQRAELMVGRGSFTESFPLFGYSLSDYDELFAEKPLRHWLSFTARHWSTGSMIPARRSPCTATVTSSPMNGRREQSSCLPTAERLPRSAANGAGRR